jgi:hypothetical protein
MRNGGVLRLRQRGLRRRNRHGSAVHRGRDAIPGRKVSVRARSSPKTSFLFRTAQQNLSDNLFFGL